MSERLLILETMPKKNTPKKTVIKKGLKKVETKRGSGTIHLEGTTKRLKDPMSVPYSAIRYHLTKNRKKAGQPHPTKEGQIILPEPQAMVLIVKIPRNDGGPRKTISLVTPPDMIINTKNVRKFIKENLEDLEGNVEEKFQGRYEDTLNTDRINDISLKFIY